MKILPFHKKLTVAVICLMLGACSHADGIGSSLFGQESEINTTTSAGAILRNLPAAKVRPVVAVYEFTDQTGQHKPNDRIAEFSRAVTQGGATILNEALIKAGSGSWFTVIERNGLDHLLRERQIIAATRQQYGAKSKLPPMLYAGVLLEGGIVSYETNTITGGLGARYLGIGGNTEYRQDIVTVYLRAVNVQNGEVLLSVNSSKTIYSSALSASTFKFVSFDEILEIETGVTMNEPPQLAVRQAIESAVYALVMDGAVKGVWEFADSDAGMLEIQRYLARLNKEELPDAEDVRPIKVAARTAPEVPAMAPVVMAEPDMPKRHEREESVTVKKPLSQVPATAMRQEDKNLENSLKEPVRQKEKSDINNSRYYQRLNDPKTQMYCTQSGCYPFPPGAEE